MIETLAGPGTEVDDLGPVGLLDALRERKATEDRAAADVLDLAARWAGLHPPESIHHAATFAVPGVEHEEPIAGEGCPAVAEFCVAELGAVLGISTVSAKRLIGRPSSFATGCLGCGHRCRRAGCRRGGPGWWPRPPSTPPRP